MKPFQSISEVADWWMATARERACSVLVDWTDIGQGIQRREVRIVNSLWTVGFPDMMPQSFGSRVMA